MPTIRALDGRAALRDQRVIELVLRTATTTADIHYKRTMKRRAELSTLLAQSLAFAAPGGNPATSTREPPFTRPGPTPEKPQSRWLVWGTLLATLHPCRTAAETEARR